MSQGRVDLNLPLMSCFYCICFYICAIIPAYFWTGALTPTVITYPIVQSAASPMVGAGAYSFLNYRPDGAPFNYECRTADQVNGSFSSCPGLYESGLLLQSVSAATTIDSSPRNHSKNDNTGYRFIGRSYGVGSAAGLTVGKLPDTLLRGYNFTQIGYSTSA